MEALLANPARMTPGSYTCTGVPGTHRHPGGAIGTKAPEVDDESSADDTSNVLAVKEYITKYRPVRCGPQGAHIYAELMFADIERRETGYFVEKTNHECMEAFSKLVGLTFAEKEVIRAFVRKLAKKNASD